MLIYVDWKLYEIHKEHNFGRTGYSKLNRPWILVFMEEFNSRRQALMIEKYLKRLKSKKYIEELIVSGPVAQR